MPYQIGVIGTGYVGLVTGTCFAESGNQVLCIDIDEDKVRTLREGKVPIYEPGLDLIFQRNIREGRLTFATELEEAVKRCELLFLCLPTPPGADGSADLQTVLSVAGDIGRLIARNDISDFRIIVDKSTVPVGTSEKVHAAVAAHCAEANFDIVSNPEFLREGFAVDDFMKPDRVVVGTSNEKSAQVMRELYKPFTRSGNPIYVLDEKSAEACKYAANSYLAMRITFMNEVAEFCEAVGANVEDVRRAIGSDSRIGKRFLFPGIGYGGSCFPKDVRALVHSGKEAGVDLTIIEAAEKANRRQTARFVDRVADRFGNDLQGKKFAVWGLAFKPNTDDTREAPAFRIIDDLQSRGAQVSAYDPEAMDASRRRFGDTIDFAADMYAALEGADALLICTEWSEFRNPDFKRTRQLLKDFIIFDGRNVFETDAMREMGAEYHSIGRASVGG